MMVYVCRKCGGSYAADAEHPKGLCPMCRCEPEPGAEPEQRNPVSDWREPLYQYAVQQEQSRRTEGLFAARLAFARLGGYRDADKRLAVIAPKADAAFAEAAKTIREEQIYGGRIQSAVIAMQAMSVHPEAAELVRLGEERLREMKEREEKARAERQAEAKRARRRRNRICLTVAASVALLLLLFEYVVIPMRFRQADALLAAGGYDEAQAIYEKNAHLTHTRRGLMGSYNAQMAKAKALSEQENYEQAYALYMSVAEHAEQDAGERTNSAPLHLLADDAREAAAQVCGAWVAALEAAGDYAGAMERLMLTPEGEARTARHRELMSGLALQHAQAAIGYTGSDRAAHARRLGEELHLIDAQLIYCHALHEAGLDLSAVYPDGVTVTDADLTAYWPDAEDAKTGRADLSAALLFARDEVPYEELYGFDLIAPVHKRSDAGKYTVRLLPGPLFAQEGMTPARSMEEATAVIIADAVYRHAGRYSFTTYISMDGKKHDIKTSYPYFTAINAIAAYSTADPAARHLTYAVTEAAPCADPKWRLAFGDNRMMTMMVENRVGAFHTADMMDALDDALDQIAR
ncbi:MAG: hypothetical protein J6K32_00530 [Clostridia bacterium]|nr:hypothetical protein [Clostridia bacterium]